VTVTRTSIFRRRAPYVLAVGGTTLRVKKGQRVETVWSSII
jgi:hypothetical protein